MRILVTGGAGFIGSHLCDLLLAAGHEVISFDNLDPQVHPGGKWPGYQPDRQSLTKIKGDVRQPSLVANAMKGVDMVVHLAAKVGVGQGQYQFKDYYEHNVLGTAVVLDVVAKNPKVKRVFVAGSMSAYGEGLQEGFDGRIFRGARTLENMQNSEWRVFDGDKPLPHAAAYPIAETDPLDPTSFYALTKAEQERMALMFSQTHNTPVFVGRFFNCYGTRQALGNPYTGVVAIFANQLLAGERPTIYEDGHQTRDFINVQDLCGAIQTLLLAPQGAAGVYNIGTGTRTSIYDMASTLARVLGSNLAPQVTGKFRVGDIRHCFANNTKLRALGWSPIVTLDSGLEVLFDWLRRQAPQKGLQEKAHKELEDRGLIG